MLIWWLLGDLAFFLLFGDSFSSLLGSLSFSDFYSGFYFSASVYSYFEAAMLF
jgi:hypothetical protein